MAAEPRPHGLITIMATPRSNFIAAPLPVFHAGQVFYINSPTLGDYKAFELFFRQQLIDDVADGVQDLPRDVRQQFLQLARDEAAKIAVGNDAFNGLVYGSMGIILQLQACLRCHHPTITMDQAGELLEQAPEKFVRAILDVQQTESSEPVDPDEFRMPRRGIDFNRIYRQLVGEPFLLTPAEIDKMTFSQLSLYFQETEDTNQPTAEDIVEHIEKYRRQQAGEE